jgi:hypothetical protein
LNEKRKKLLEKISSLVFTKRGNLKICCPLLAYLPRPTVDFGIKLSCLQAFDQTDSKSFPGKIQQSNFAIEIIRASKQTKRR